MEHHFKAKAVLVFLTILFINLFTVNFGNSTFPADKPTLYVNPPHFQPREIGDLFQINIDIYNVTSLYRYAFKLEFNPNLLKCLQVKLGAFFQEGYPVQPSEINNTGGYVLVQYSLTGLSTKNGSGTLNVLTFNATYATPLFNVTCSLALRNTYLLNRKLEHIPHYVQYGEYESPWIPPSLNLTVTTNKQQYNLSDYVYIFGNLTAGSSAVKDGLVAIEVRDPKGDPLVIRTRPTSTNITWDWDTEITQMIPCDKYGTPKDVFNTGEDAYFKVTIINDDLQAHIALVTVNIYDSNMASMGVNFFADVHLSPESTSHCVIPVFIDESAPVGEASAYASVLTGWPKNQGAPYCPEKSVTFKISDGGGAGGGGVPVNFTANGQSYNLSFQLPSGLKGGVYHLWVGSKYRGLKAFNNTIFSVEKSGDVNGDGFVNLFDLTIVGAAWDSRPGDANWDERADIDGNGWVYLPDLTIVGTNWEG